MSARPVPTTLLGSRMSGVVITMKMANKNPQKGRRHKTANKSTGEVMGWQERILLRRMTAPVGLSSIIN
jgi:hypothetical protein